MEIIADKQDTVVCRLLAENHSAVLKMYKETHSPVEMMVYRLLGELGVPTLQAYGTGPNWILLEDLDSNITWRLATAEDVESEQIGVAVATWFRVLHNTGTEFLRATCVVPPFLKRECDMLTTESILETGARLEMSDLRLWKFAAEHVEELKSAFRLYPETLNYNDFHWTNLAVSRDEPIRAVVFDYHLLGIGPVWSDIRNVCGSLGPLAREAFLASYGELDDGPALLDRPLSMLCSLQAASLLPKLPKWAEECLSTVRKGDFESLLAAALQACR